jgi:hypothetical protein
MYTWITKRNNKVYRIRQTDRDVSPGPEWSKVPENWNGSQGDSILWFDEDMRRIPDSELVKQGKRKDNQGLWFNKDNRETKIIHRLDEEIDDNWTRKKPLENELYQKWDEDSGSWIVDAVEKEKAEKESQIAEKKSDIENAEKRIQRSIRAKLNGTATTEDEQYFQQITAEIDSLRKELKKIIAA